MKDGTNCRPKVNTKKQKEKKYLGENVKYEELKDVLLNKRYLRDEMIQAEYNTR